MTAEEAIKLLGTAKQSLKEQVPVLTKINPQTSKSLEENALMIIEAYSMAIEALETIAELEKRGITIDTINEYKTFEDECVSKGFTFKSLLEAREKQIPKKPIVEKPICGDCGDRVCGYCQGEFANRYICSCGRVWKGFPRRIPYCDVCGQAIDWSEE